MVRARTLVIDAVVGALGFVASVGLARHGHVVDPDLRGPDEAAYVLLALYSASPLLRRRAPVAATAGGLLLGVAYSAAHYPVALTPLVLLSEYSAATVLSGRAGRTLLAVSVVLAAFEASLSAGPTDLAIPALVVCAWLLGNYVGTQRRAAVTLQRKHAELEAAQAELAGQAVAEERLRIARELHDVVSHTMSVVALHAGTGRMIAAVDPDGAAEALAIIETATRSALVEMRTLLGVLRSDGTEGELAPAPGLSDVSALVSAVRRSGVAVDLSVAGDAGGVPAGVSLSGYRILQEALTNVLKHAGPNARAAVVLRVADDAVIIEVEDDGRGPVSPAPPGGNGLVGMRERAAAHGGHLEAGPRPSGGFRVEARLPLGRTSP